MQQLASIAQTMLELSVEEKLHVQHEHIYMYKGLEIMISNSMMWIKLDLCTQKEKSQISRENLSRCTFILRCGC